VADFSVAPAGAVSAGRFYPQLALWATGVRCSAAWGWTIMERGIYAASIFKTSGWLNIQNHVDVEAA